MKKDDWAVCHDRNGEPGQEIVLSKSFHWGGKHHKALSAYVCEEGLVLDFCTEIPVEEEKRFLEKWEHRIQRGLTRQEAALLRQENPLNTWHQCCVCINGVQVKNQHASGNYWIPQSIQSETESYSNQTEPYLLHYGLSSQCIWSFRRVVCDWPEGMPDALTALEVKLISEPAEVHGAPFWMPAEGECRSIQNPVTYQEHLLTVVGIQKESITIPERFADYEMPTQATLMQYTLTPDLGREEFQLRDCREQDQARGQDGKPYHAGAVGMMLRIPKDGTHIACSSMRFSAPDTVEWEPVFRTKNQEDVMLSLL